LVHPDVQHSRFVRIDGTKDKAVIRAAPERRPMAIESRLRFRRRVIGMNASREPPHYG
jgi:hypothetical protein